MDKKLMIRKELELKVWRKGTCGKIV